MQANRQAVTQFYVMPYEVIIGQNPENADMSNPRGYTYGTRAVVVAANDHGDTWELPMGSGHASDVVPVAQALCEALNARLALGKLPVGFDAWREGRPVYGSDAYMAYGQDDDLAWEHREAAEEAWR